VQGQIEMNGAVKIIKRSRLSGLSRCSAAISRPLCRAVHSRETRPLWRQQALPQQIQVRQCEGGEQPRGILRQAAVATLVKPDKRLTT